MRKYPRPMWLCLMIAKIKTYLLRCLKVTMGLVLLLFLAVVAVDFGVSYMVRDRVYTDLATLPKREYAMVLGTAKYYPGGAPNLYYKYRLEAAARVILADKADYLLLSGDNRAANYNEPKMMTEDLQKMGIMPAHLKQDYAGYSTFDSVIRADKVFKLQPFTIISQAFHCERALVIAQFHHIDAICYEAKHPEAHYWVRIREFLARSAMLVGLVIGREATTLEPSQPAKK